MVYNPWYMATIKQEKVFRDVVVNGSTISGAMVKAGYSAKTSQRTNKVTRTKGWEELKKKYLDDGELAKKHNEQLNASKLTKLYFDIDDDEEMIADVVKRLGCELLYIKTNKAQDGQTAYVKAPDFFFRDLALDKGYKVKGRYSAEGVPNSNNVLIIQVSEAVANKNALTMNSDIALNTESSRDGHTSLPSPELRP